MNLNFTHSRWDWVPGYDERYAITIDGTVFDVDRQMEVAQTSRGLITLTRNGKRQQLSVKKLVDDIFYNTKSDVLSDEELAWYMKTQYDWTDEQVKELIRGKKQ